MDQKLLDAIEKVMHECLDAAGEVQRKYFAAKREGRGIEAKGASFDLVTEADKESERVIIDRVSAAFPNHSIVAEESGSHERPNAPATWYIDPLDGTTNFAHGLPIFSISIGVSVGDEPALGAVYNPVREDLFLGRAGRGATLNGAPIHVSDSATLETSLLVTGFPYDRRERADHYLGQYKAFMMCTRGVLRLGSAALDLCQVASGRLDGYYEESLHHYDWAAGILIVREAGGRVSDYIGGDAMLARKEVCASNGRIHPAMLEILKLDAIKA
ncbi:inositol monophosphatase [Candidatus Sumerlaeota bacterium]|nr:inositol monophosphatase [Candidatus Sumerlaeota bacterium]